MEFETLAVHAGQEPDPNNGAVMTPIYQTSTYLQDGVGKGPGRLRIFADQKSDPPGAGELPGSTGGWAIRPGLLFWYGSHDTVLRLVDSGAQVLAGNDVYGGTFRLFDKVLRRYGLRFDFIDTTDPENLAEALTPLTRLVWLETPSNPLLSLTDIQAVARSFTPKPTLPCWWWTIPLPHPTCNIHSS